MNRATPDLKPIYRDYFSASATWKNLVIEMEYSSTKKLLHVADLGISGK